MKVIPDTRRVH